MNKSQVRITLAFGVLGVTSSSFIFLEADKDPYSIAFVRVFLTGTISYALISRYSKSESTPITRRDLVKILLAGFSLATHFSWWFASLNYIPVGISLALTNTAPIWLALIVIFVYKQKPQSNQILSMIFVILGSYLLFLDSDSLEENGLEGLTLAMGSAFGFAIYLILARSMVPKLGLWRYFGLVNLTSALTILPWIFVRDHQSDLLDHYLWFWGLMLAIFPGIMGHAIYNFSMSKLDPIDVSISTLGEPVLGTVIAYIFLDQYLTISQLDQR
ncbi:MAG: DMT family transporter [Candidatus Kariarchaeaceae archaeon]|jgi:drug/metabolite transporter (DMT)-like permease